SCWASAASASRRRSAACPSGSAPSWSRSSAADPPGARAVTARLFVISGPSGVGKGTLIALARESLPELAVATSATTRPMRPGEADGREYHFLDEDEFVRRVGEGEFLEHVTFAGYRYGTLRSEVERRLARDESVVLEIDVPGAREI